MPASLAPSQPQTKPPYSRRIIVRAQNFASSAAQTDYTGSRQKFFMSVSRIPGVNSLNNLTDRCVQYNAFCPDPRNHRHIVLTSRRCARCHHDCVACDPILRARTTCGTGHQLAAQSNQRTQPRASRYDRRAAVAFLVRCRRCTQEMR